MRTGPGLGIVEPGLGDGGFNGVVLTEVQAMIRRGEMNAVLTVDGMVAGLLGMLVRVIALYHGWGSGEGRSQAE